MPHYTSMGGFQLRATIDVPRRPSMNYSRRELSRLLPALALASAAAQNRALPSKAWRFEDLVLKKNSRAVLNGETHAGFNIALHATELPSGEAPHPPHPHVH